MKSTRRCLLTFKKFNSLNSFLRCCKLAFLMASTGDACRSTTKVTVPASAPVALRALTTAVSKSVRRAIALECPAAGARHPARTGQRRIHVYILRQSTASALALTLFLPPR